MRKAIERQQRLDGGSVSQVMLNFGCRDELIPVLRGLQEIYATTPVRDQILKLVAQIGRASCRERVYSSV